MSPSVNPSPGLRVLLVVGGGIAAYKSPDLVRRLVERGCVVRVVMTAAATAFVAPLTFQAVSGHPVRTDLLDPGAEAGMDHIELARWAERLLVAPATADLIARLSLGLADDLATTLALACQAPLYLAPTMNQAMWRHPATQENLDRLRQRGAQVLGPGDGSQACGDVGPGRMLEPQVIADQVARLAAVGSLTGVRVLVTAGPTQEPLDPVRFLGNRSSGRMGYALAEALAGLGAAVELVSGPTSLPAPAGVPLVLVQTALEMHAAVMDRVAACDIFVGCAAVADYRPETPADNKIKKSAVVLELRLVRNPDILAEVAARPAAPFTVGFAAETQLLEEGALEKLSAKRLDMVAANQVGGASGGFEHADNALLVFWAGGRRVFPLMPKALLGEALANLIAERYVAST